MRLSLCMGIKHDHYLFWVIYYIFGIGKENLHIIYKNDCFLAGEYAKIKTKRYGKILCFAVPGYNN